MEETQATPPATKGSSKNMMIIAVVIVLLLLGVGGYYMMNQNAKQPEAQTTATTEVKPTSAGMFASIKDALSKSISLECSFKDTSGTKTTAYIKAGAVRSDFTGSTAAQSGSVIMKDKMMYFWNGKKGMKMAFDMEQMAKDMPKVTGTTATQQNPGDYMSALEKYKENCKPATVSDSLFVPPTDVTFVDQTKMMQDAQKMMKSVTPGQGMSEEQIKTMQQKYQPQPTTAK